MTKKEHKLKTKRMEEALGQLTSKGKLTKKYESEYDNQDQTNI